MRGILFAFLSFLFMDSLVAQTDSLFIRKLANEIFAHSTAYSNLRTLTKTVGPRLNGSPQTYQAESWGQKALKEAGADSVYLQKAKIPHWERGGKDLGAMISGNKRQDLAVIALGNSVSTKPGGITAPVMMVHNWEELDKRKDEVKSKIVFFNHPFDPDQVFTFFAYRDAVPYRGNGANRASKYGAVGMLVRSMSESTDNFPHTGALRYNDSFPKIPAFAVGLKDADKIATELATEKSLNIFLSTSAHSLPDTVGYNVIGEWKGTEFPDQYIVVGGHLDSWDPAEGAHDDGAGCVHAIEVLRSLKALGYKPKHTIRVILFTDEENSGGGADAYATSVVAKKEKHVFALESDAGGFTPRSFSMKGTPAQFAAMQNFLPFLSPYGVSYFDHFGSGADVEGLTDSTGALSAELIPDSQRYFDYHHAANDVFENVNKRELELGAINMAALIYLVDKNGL